MGSRTGCQTHVHPLNSNRHVGMDIRVEDLSEGGKMQRRFEKHEGKVRTEFPRCKSAHI